VKYWNKGKETRRQHWHTVQRPIRPGWHYARVKRELQLTDSPGRFYLYYGSDTVWFEREQDAVWFLLRWS
jgi:hypothetical protein